MNVTEPGEATKPMLGDHLGVVRKLAELNSDLWGKLSAKQLELLRLYFETTAKQFEVGKDVSRVDELLTKQMQVAREYGQDAMRINREILDLLSGSRDTYQAWLDDLMNQSGKQVSQVAEAATVPRKSA